MTDKDNEKSQTSAREEARENFSAKVKDAAESIRELVRSVGIGIEERIALQDQVDNIAKETESMLNRLDSIANKNQRKLLLAYRAFLQRNMDEVNQRLKELE
jgi:hypothetical protein